MNSLKCFFIDFYRKMKKFEPKKHKIMKKLKTLLTSRNFVIWFCDLHLFLVISCFRTSKIHLSLPDLQNISTKDKCI